MIRFFQNAYNALKDDGYFIIWFTHSSLEVWESLFRWLYDSGFVVEKTWQIWSESPTRMVALQTSAFFTSMVIVARKLERKPIMGVDSDEFIKAVEEAVHRSLDVTWDIYGGLTREAVVMALADGQAVATRFRLIGGGGAMFGMLYNYATRYAIEGVLSYLARRHNLERIYENYVSGVDRESLLYVFALITMPKGRNEVPYDFFEKIKKVLNAGGIFLKKKNRSYIVPVGMELLDYARIRRYGFAITRATELLLIIARDLPRLGVSGIIKGLSEGGIEYNVDKKDVALALFLVRVLPEYILSRFNISPLIKDSVIEVLEGLIERL